MEHDIKRQRLFNFWFIVISVLLHALLFWFLFFLKHYNDQALFAAQQQAQAIFNAQSAQQQENAANQNQAASVIFEDEPEPEVPAKKPIEWTTGGIKQPEPMTSEPVDEELAYGDQQAMQEVALPEKKAQETANSPEQTEEEAVQQATIAQEQPFEKTIVVSDKQAEQITEKKAPKPSKKQQQASEKLTLATLARGFLNQMHEKSKKAQSTGGHLVNMVGDRTGNPTADQLKYERYFQKIDANLKNAMRIHRYKFEDIARTLNSVKTTCVVFVNLSRNGKIKTVEVSTSTNIHLMDDFLLFLVREAAFSFPPVPKYIAEDPLAFSIQFPIEIRNDNRSFGFHRS